MANIYNQLLHIFSTNLLKTVISCKKVQNEGIPIMLMSLEVACVQWFRFNSVENAKWFLSNDK